ncbi:MAG: hypothetical protein N2235_05600 [Fischerella sp.]|nr:hypothetical protein [Fischerella sp.]
MESQIRFLLKVFLLSAAISVLIKYAGYFFCIPATTMNALILVFLPTVLMAIALLWRFQAQKQS